MHPDSLHDALQAVCAAQADPARAESAMARVHHHLAAAERGGPRQSLPFPVAGALVPAPGHAWIWAAAAALLLLAACGVARALPVPQPARLIALQGTLQNAGAPVALGGEVGLNRPLRTAAASDALLLLADGSRLEIGPATALQLASVWGSTRVELERGRILVQAAHQAWLRHLYVTTPDCRVAVKGTIFAVERALQGSRVSVVEGLVEVTRPRATDWLAMGEQSATSPALPPLPVAAAIAWSRNAAAYRALLGLSSAPERGVVEAPQPAGGIPAPAPPPAAFPAAAPPLPAPPPAATAPVRSMPPPASPAIAPQQAPKKPAPAAPDPTAPAHILALARAAVADVPAELQPDFLEKIAGQQQTADPEAAAATLVAAFQAAVALPP
ncbi:MAG: FecR family protein, partial [Terriglobales bacterium]